MIRFLGLSLLLGSAACAAQSHQPATAAGSSVAVTVAALERPKASPQALALLPALPDLSPRASVSQVVGITHMRVDYASPAVRERAVWGELVPYGEKWRAGANAPTRLEFSSPVQLGEQTVPPGSYTVLVVPQENDPWTLILNRDPENRGVYGHDAAHDAATLELAAEEAPPRERLTYLFEDTTDVGTHLVLDWAGRRLRVPVSVDTPSLVEASIQETMASAWRPPYQAGRYLLENGGDAARAAALLEASMAVQHNSWNQWFHALAMAKLERQLESCEGAQRALAAAEEGSVFARFYAARVQKHLATCGN